MRKSHLLLALFTLFLAFPAGVHADRFVALVVTGPDGADRADTVQNQLQALGAETLRATAPNNAQMRSILQRFVREAAGARASLVYLDAPLVASDGRAYVLPEGARLNRATDLFTEAIPLQAFARSAAQSQQGGAVITIGATVPSGLPTELTEVTQAPAPLPGSAPILVAGPEAFDQISDTLDVEEAETVELGALLDSMGRVASLSAAPLRPIFLKQAAQTEAPASLIVPPGTELATDDSPVPEQALSRSAKRALQRQLRNRGHYSGLVDGIFGPQTRAAIATFQTEQGAEATGLLTQAQMRALATASEI